MTVRYLRLGGYFEIDVCRDAREACSGAGNLCTNLAFALGPGKNTETLDLVGQMTYQPAGRLNSKFHLNRMYKFISYEQ